MLLYLKLKVENKHIYFHQVYIGFKRASENNFHVWKMWIISATRKDILLIFQETKPLRTLNIRKQNCTYANLFCKYLFCKWIMIISEACTVEPKRQPGVLKWVRIEFSECIISINMKHIFTETLLVL